MKIKYVSSRCTSVSNLSDVVKSVSNAYQTHSSLSQVTTINLRSNFHCKFYRSRLLMSSVCASNAKWAYSILCVQRYSLPFDIKIQSAKLIQPNGNTFESENCSMQIKIQMDIKRERKNQIAACVHWARGRNTRTAIKKIYTKVVSVAKIVAVSRFVIFIFQVKCERKTTHWVCAQHSF